MRLASPGGRPTGTLHIYFEVIPLFRRTLPKLFIAGLLWGAFFLFAYNPAGAGSTSLNGQTDNLNVLFIGFEDDRLAMVAIYSINHRDQFQSGAVFFPLHGEVPGQKMDFWQYYREKGLLNLRQVLEESLDISIAYHVTIKNSIMDEVEKIIGPLTVNGRKIDLKGIFTMAPSPQDEEMLGELVRRLTRSEVYFWHLPRLCLTARHHISTDFPLTLDNLWLHYRIASQIKTQSLKKFILPLEYRFSREGIRWQFREELLKRIIHDLTTAKKESTASVRAYQKI